MTYSIHFEKYYDFSYGDFEEKLDRFLKWPSEAHLLAKIFDDYPEPEPIDPPSFEEFKSFIDNKGVRYEEQVYKSCWHYKKKHSDLPFNPYCLVALMVACRVVCKYDVIARIIC